MTRVSFRFYIYIKTHIFLFFLYIFIYFNILYIQKTSFGLLRPPSASFGLLRVRAHAIALSPHTPPFPQPRSSGFSRSHPYPISPSISPSFLSSHPPPNLSYNDVYMINEAPRHRLYLYYPQKPN